MDIFVIGGGAAGLSSAISSARNGATVTVLEAGKKPASKILKTGGGRCNYTNMNISCDSYYCDDKDTFLKTFLYKFDASDALCFFESIGVLPLIRDGYVYPINEEAKTISNSLIAECERLGVVIRNNTSVNNIVKVGNKFDIFVDEYVYHADKVIIASGGLALSNTKQAKLMYDISYRFGHNIAELFPSLVSLSTDNFLGVVGVRVYAKVSLGKHSEIGEIHFTKDGISGIPIMNICRHYYKDLNTLVFDFLPTLSEEELYNKLDEGVPIKNLIPEKLAIALDNNHLSPKHLEVKIVKINDYDHAQVTRGGISKDEINPETMESKLCPGLYFAGEIIDVDGRCGGYNLHFAWGSGVIAGVSASGSNYNHKVASLEQLRRWEKAEIGSRRSSNNE